VGEGKTVTLFTQAGFRNPLPSVPGRPVVPGRWGGLATNRTDPRHSNLEARGASCTAPASEAGHGAWPRRPANERTPWYPGMLEVCGFGHGAQIQRLPPGTPDRKTYCRPVRLRGLAAREFYGRHPRMKSHPTATTPSGVDPLRWTADSGGNWGCPVPVGGRTGAAPARIRRSDWDRLDPDREQV